MNPEHAKVIDKVRKLLALAQNAGAAPNEAATAARQAQALMKKHNLEQSDVIFKELKDRSNMEMQWVRATTRKNAPRPNADTPLWAQFIAIPCADLFDCQVNMRRVQLRQGSCSVVTFYGYKTDVQICAWTYEYLIDCVRRLGRDFEEAAERLARAGHANSNRESLDAFRTGCAQKIAARLRQLLEQKRQEERGNSTSTALVVSKQAAVNEAFPEQCFGREDAGKYTKSAVAMMAGRIAGSKVNLNPTPLEDKTEQRKQIE